MCIRDRLGTMAAIYNFPYYPQHLERMGYEKDQDWHEFKIYIPEGCLLYTSR